jgi:hypothetical protein
MAFFVDTNVCSKWESNPEVHANWLKESARLKSQGHEYVSCSLILLELLSRLAKPEPAYFSSDLRSFVFLSNNGTTRILPFPAKFALKAALGIDSPVSKFEGSDFQQWLDCVRSSPSREALTTGDVEIGSTLFTYGIASVS